MGNTQSGRKNLLGIQDKQVSQTHHLNPMLKFYWWQCITHGLWGSDQLCSKDIVESLLLQFLEILKISPLKIFILISIWGVKKFLGS